MKIGILTFHNAFNYGAILQAYATQELVKNYGHNVEIIDYQNEAINRFYDQMNFSLGRLPKKKFWMIPRYLIERYFFWKRKKSYQLFKDKYIQLSEKKDIREKSVIIDGYDAILIGSDQIWNKKLTGGLDDVYWGNFCSSKSVRKVAWSACMGDTNFNDGEINYIRNNIKNFYAVSVREDNLQSFLKSVTQVLYPQTIDPTLMLNKEKWDLLCHPVKESNYIMVYAVQDENKTIEFARVIAKFMNKKILIVRSHSEYYWSKENKEHAGPAEFLSYIKYADFVITTSFHGTAFSLLFQKQFVCPVFRKNSRVESLLKEVGLSDRRIKNTSEINNLPPIDYSIVSSKMELLKQETSSFLNSVL